MPRRVEFTPALSALINAQDGVISTAQLMAHGVGPDPVKHRVQRGHWRRVLPGVLVTHGGELTRRQRMMAAALWAGPECAIDAASAAGFFGFQRIALSLERVEVVVPFESPARTRDWVKVRRTIAEIEVFKTERLRYVVEPMAILVAARDVRNVSRAIDMLSRGLQMGKVTELELQAAREMLGRKGCGALDRALGEIGIGLRSTSESWFRDLVLRSHVLPEPIWNQWLDLGDGGRPICADGLWKDAGMLHEVQGREYHAWGQEYESTSARTERVVAAGLVHTGSTPLRLAREGSVVLGNLERTYRLHAGSGMPPGVTLIDPPAWTRQSRGAA